MRQTDLINYALYQFGWFACVLGAASHRPWTGCSIAMILIAGHVALSRERRLELRLVLLAAAVGMIVEVMQIAAGMYRFTSGTVVAALPPAWLLIMWGQFATTFRYGLRPVIASPTRAALLGAAGGPLAFVAGQRLGAVTLLPPLTHSLLRLSVGWALALAVCSVGVQRLTQDRDSPRYRKTPSEIFRAAGPLMKQD